jgi:hypothetical protein
MSKKWKVNNVYQFSRMADLGLLLRFKVLSMESRLWPSGIHSMYIWNSTIHQITWCHIPEDHNLKGYFFIGLVGWFIPVAPTWSIWHL